MQLHVDLPDALADRDSQELAALAREALVVRLYALGELSSARERKRLAFRAGSFSISWGATTFPSSMTQWTCVRRRGLDKGLEDRAIRTTWHQLFREPARGYAFHVSSRE